MKNHRNSKVNKYQLWFNRGQELSRIGKYSEALASYRRALELQPSSYQAWIALGRVLTYLDCYEEALKSFEQALQNYSYDEASCYS